MVMTFDEHNPDNWSDAALHTISGDLHSKWADKSCSMVAFRNGRFGSIGEVKVISENLFSSSSFAAFIFQHSCFDGTVSVTSMMFHILTLLEYPEPDWNGPAMNVENRITEIHFDVDQHIKTEVERVTTFVQETVSLPVNVVPDCVQWIKIHLFCRGIG